MAVNNEVRTKKNGCKQRGVTEQRIMMVKQRGDTEQRTMTVTMRCDRTKNYDCKE